MRDLRQGEAGPRSPVRLLVAEPRIGIVNCLRAGVVRVVAVVVVVGLVAAGCAVRGADPALVPIAAAPASVDPATTTFTCPGVPDSSVEAVLGEVSLSPTMWRSDKDGTVKSLECEGLVHASGDLSRVFFARFGRNVPGRQPWKFVRIPQGRFSETFDVPGVEGATGTVSEPGPGTGALITCGDSFILVSLSGRAHINGDVKANATNLAISLTPWACNGQPIPGLGVPLGSAPPENTPTPTQTP